ncbi:putative solute carrier family 13 [Neospora caninum Liverpool]|uniref:Putative solute carrier family 13 n=1 Tax=Neospora caninum (strain Liverpool) TaxID=572307 RepID=F0VHL4_NEOCL|nr:putative solute carrier family 13 [Neospora caninum Liverpool]CBZ53208.1 putative solute carrier family 13 [Neospora caninum Liverpool]CEL67198.1 TPA: solute carrier family 13, putative [Neospora caninum Liverpool]|eukprot:XP_003883240.1 putative solute carrier family 13 [Neospora caninum Liverpool]
MPVRIPFIGYLPLFQRRGTIKAEVDDCEFRQGDQRGYDKSYTTRRFTPIWVQRALDHFLSTRKVWLTIFSALIPLLLFLGLSPYDVKYRCLYIILVVILNWLSAANDAVVVALYPLILCPLLGVTGVKTLAQAYFRSVSFLMIGTCLLGASFTRTGLDKTVASLILNKSGSDPAILCLALMLASFSLSMWINNASATVILSPIAGRIVGEWGRLNNRKNHMPHRHQFECRSQLPTDTEHGVGPWAPADPPQEPPGESAATSPSATQETTPTNSLARQLPRTVPANSDRSVKEGIGKKMVGIERGNVKEGVRDTEHFPQNLRHIRNMMYIGLSYSATLGGVSTLSGSFVNLILVQLLETSYKFGQSAELSNPVTVSNWMAFSFPFALLSVLGSWFVLGCLWLRPRLMLRTVSRLPLSVLRGLGSGLRTCGRRVGKLVSRAWTTMTTMPSRCSLRLLYAYEGGSLATPATPEPSPIRSTQPGDLDASGLVGGIVRCTSEAGGPSDEACCNQPGEETTPGTLTFAQLEVLACLLCLITVWLTRVSLPGGRPGWASFFPAGYVDDAVPVLCIGILLFFLPLDAPNFGSWGRHRKRSSQRMKENAGTERSLPAAVVSDGSQGTGGVRLSKPSRRSSYRSILVYSYASKHIEWGALLLLGGGFALATSITETGLDKWLGSALLGLGNLSPPALVFCVVLITSSVTEIMSNTAAANVLLPILSGVTSSIPYSPLLMLLPATVGVQLAFMLPIGTAPNAIILKQGRLHSLDLFISGLFVKMVSVCLIVLAMFTWGSLLFDVTSKPLCSQ